MGEVVDDDKAPVAVGEGGGLLLQHFGGWQHVHPLVDDGSRGLRILTLPGMLVRPIRPVSCIFMGAAAVEFLAFPSCAVFSALTPLLGERGCLEGAGWGEVVAGQSERVLPHVLEHRLELAVEVDDVGIP